MALEDIEGALAEYGRLIAKPVRDGSSYGLMFVNSTQDLVAVRLAAKTEEYLIEPFIAGIEATCGVLEQLDGSLIALPPIEIIPAEGPFDYAPNILPRRRRRFARDVLLPKSAAQLMDQALKAHRALSCSGYSRSDFIISDKGPVFSRNQHVAGSHQGLAISQGAQSSGHRLRRFPQGPDHARRKTRAEVGRIVTGLRRESAVNAQLR